MELILRNRDNLHYPENKDGKGSDFFKKNSEQGLYFWKLVRF
jgi:hypothetical protein